MLPAYIAYKIIASPHNRAMIAIQKLSLFKYRYRGQSGSGWRHRWTQKLACRVRDIVWGGQRALGQSAAVLYSYSPLMTLAEIDVDSWMWWMCRKETTPSLDTGSRVDPARDYTKLSWLMIDAAVSSGGYHTVKLVFFNNPIMTCGHSMTRPSTKIQTRRGGGFNCHGRNVFCHARAVIGFVIGNRQVEFYTAFIKQYI